MSKQIRSDETLPHITHNVKGKMSSSLTPYPTDLLNGSNVSTLKIGVSGVRMM